MLIIHLAAITNWLVILLGSVRFPEQVLSENSFGGDVTLAVTTPTQRLILDQTDYSALWWRRVVRHY